MIKSWCEVTDILNALPGAQKTWKQWQKVIKNIYTISIKKITHKIIYVNSYNKLYFNIS